MRPDCDDLELVCWECLAHYEGELEHCPGCGSDLQPPEVADDSELEAA